MKMPKRTRSSLIFTIFTICAALSAHADVALLMEEPFGNFGDMNPTGHAAIYLNRVCAETPTQLRRCEAGEPGVVISRYHRVGGYDWLAIPLIPYLYAVDNVADIPDRADAKIELRLRDHYRREHLLDLIPDDPKREIPSGEWVQLIGASYDRRIYGFAIDTSSEQDDALIEDFSQRPNTSRFNLLFRNCANFSAGVINYYYPHSAHRNFIADAGIMTPKQLAKSIVKYDKRNSEMNLRTFIIPQVPGSIHRSAPVDGVVESLVKSKKYVLPLAFLHPVITGGLVAAYISNGRFHSDPKATIYNPALELEPGTAAMSKPAATAGIPAPTETLPAESNASIVRISTGSEE